MKRLGFAGFALAAALLATSSSAWAVSLSQGEIKLLKSILPHISYVGEGVGGKPTIQFSGVNVQIVNGEGKTASVNGEGNLVIGYHEGVICFEEQDCHGGHVETGSHNLVVGIGQSYTSYAGIIGGRHNTASDPNSFVVGRLNQTSGFDCVCAAASVSGGEQNTSSGWGTVSGGTGNTAREDGLVSGGAGNLATFDGSVLGGQDNMASATEGSSVSGGYKNIAEGRFSLVFGGKEVIAKAGYEACGGYPSKVC